MKNNSKFKNLFLLIIITMSVVGSVFAILFCTFHTVNGQNIFDSIWLYNIDDITDDFTKEQVNASKANLAQQNLFYYNQLNEDEQDIFNYIYLGIQNRYEEISFKKPITIDLLTRIIYIIKFDCPENYFLSESFNYDIKGKKVLTYYPSYIITEQQYNDMQKEVNIIADDIKILTENMSEYDKELTIHDYIVQNCDYTTETQNCNNMYGCLVEGQANCEGYSSAFEYLLRQVGVQSTQVIGEVNMQNQTVGHSWNLAKIDNEYYYSDLSWDDLEDIPEYEDIRFHHVFFNTTYDEMTSCKDIRKTQEYLGTIPESTANKYNYYENIGYFVSSLEDAQALIETKLPSIVSSNETFLVIKCNGKEVYDELNANVTNIMQKVINDNNLAVTKCKYAKIENGYALIIHGLTY